jgi:hypothetical protein
MTRKEVKSYCKERPHLTKKDCFLCLNMEQSFFSHMGSLFRPLSWSSKNLQFHTIVLYYLLFISKQIYQIKFCTYHNIENFIFFIILHNTCQYFVVYVNFMFIILQHYKLYYYILFFL